MTRLKKSTVESDAKKRPQRDSNRETIRDFDINKVPFELKCKNASQKKLINLINDNSITICSGPAGTGKTFVSCAQAFKLLKTGKYDKIMLVKSVTVLEGEELGYLKGSLSEKLEPIMISFLDNFYKLIGEDNTNSMIENKYIDIQPLTYLRGRSIDRAIILIDEAQNISLSNMRSVMTRIGDGSKMVITGDTKQIDLKNKKQSSLETVVNIFGDKKDIASMVFEISDIVRNPIIMMIEEEFDKYEESMKSNKG